MFWFHLLGFSCLFLVAIFARAISDDPGFLLDQVCDAGDEFREAVTLAKELLG